MPALADRHEQVWSEQLGRAAEAVAAGDLARAEAILRESLGLLGDSEAELLARATTLNNLGYVLHREGRYGEARQAYASALAIREQLLGADDPSVAQVLNNLGELERAAGRLAEAAELHARALDVRERVRGPDHPETAQSLIARAVVLTELGRLDEARPLAERALGILGRAYGEEDPRIADALLAVAAIASRQDRLDEAAALYRRALALQEAKAEPDPAAIRNTLVQLAEVLRRAGRSAEAVPLLEDAVERAEPELAEWAPARERARIHNDLGVNLYETGEFERARDELERAVELYAAEAGVPAAEALAPLVNLAAVLTALHENEAAVATLGQAIRRAEGGDAGARSELARLWNDLGALQFTLGRYREAAESLAKAVEIAGADAAVRDSEHAVYLRNYARVLAELDRDEEARAVLARAEALGKAAENGAGSGEGASVESGTPDAAPPPEGGGEAEN